MSRVRTSEETDALEALLSVCATTSEADRKKKEEEEEEAAATPSSSSPPSSPKNPNPASRALLPLHTSI
jgi:hypothetical protein